MDKTRSSEESSLAGEKASSSLQGSVDCVGAKKITPIPNGEGSRKLCVSASERVNFPR